MRNLFVYLFLLFSAIVFYSCSANPFIDLDSIKNKLKIVEFPVQGDYPDNDGVVLYEDHFEDIRINNDGDFETTKRVHKVTKIFRNVEKYSSEEFVVPGEDKLISVNARVINPDGKIIELKSEDFHPVFGYAENSRFYSDVQIIKFTYPSLEKNSIVEYDYRIMEKYPLIMDVWYIEGELPKLWDKYNLYVPYLLLMKKVDGGAGWGWKYKAYNCSIPNPIVKSDASGPIVDKEALFTWDLRDIPAFTPEPAMPPYSNYLRYMKFKPMRWETWNDVSKDYYNDYFKPKLEITTEVSGKAEELTKNCSSETDKIKCIYDFVQSLRYVDVDLRQGDIEPYKPETVLKHKYGDCTDKTMLIIAMLKSLGIKSSPVLVLTHDEGVIDESFPCWNFNLMIVKVVTKDGKEIWIDPSTKYCKLGFLPHQCENIGVVVLNDNGTVNFENTPKNSSSDNIENFFMKLDFSNADTVNIQVSERYKGESNLKFKKELGEKTRSEILKICKSKISDYFVNAEVTDYTISDIDSTDLDLKFEFSAKAPNNMEKQGSLTLVTVDQFKLPLYLEWLGREKRTYDIEFNYPFTIFKTVEIDLPANKYTVKDLPSNTNYNGQALSYLRTFYNYGNEKIVGTEKFSVNQSNIKVDYFDKVKEFFDKIKLRNDEKIILTNN